MFAPFFDLALLATFVQPLPQVGLPGAEPGPMGFVAWGVLSLFVWVVACWILLRAGRSVWQQIAARVRYDERDRE